MVLALLFSMKKLFINARDLRPINQHFEKLLNKLKPFKRIGLTSTIQFKHRVEEVEELLKKYEVLVIPTVLGCRVKPAAVDCTVIITTGRFHAIKVAMVTGKPVFILSPGGLTKLSEKLVNDFKKKQALRISRVIDSRVIGVLLSTKPGQSNELVAKEAVKELRSRGKDAYLFVAGDLSPSQLNDFPVDAWVNTACPRIVEDDFDKPIVNWDEFKNHFLNTS
ncbi:hypothetical protein GF352_04485 [archaeon]|nr:hypothetical protein [archaeon]